MGHHPAARGAGGRFVMTRSLCLVLLMLVAWPAYAADASLGRLFFTPAQRKALEEARRNNTRAEVQAAEKPARPPVRNVTVTGLVRAQRRREHGMGQRQAGRRRHHRRAEGAGHSRPAGRRDRARADPGPHPAVEGGTARRHSHRTYRGGLRASRGCGTPGGASRTRAAAKLDAEERAATGRSRRAPTRPGRHSGTHEINHARGATTRCGRATAAASGPGCRWHPGAHWARERGKRGSRA